MNFLEFSDLVHSASQVLSTHLSVEFLFNIYLGRQADNQILLNYRKTTTSLASGFFYVFELGSALCVFERTQTLSAHEHFNVVINLYKLSRLYLNCKYCFVIYQPHTHERSLWIQRHQIFSLYDFIIVSTETELTDNSNLFAEVRSEFRSFVYLFVFCFFFLQLSISCVPTNSLPD